MAARFASAWTRFDYGAMYRMLTPAARRRTALARFEATYRQAAATATAVRIASGAARESGPGAQVPITVTTRIFGIVRGNVLVPVTDGSVDWTPDLVFPGLARGATLTRVSRAPRRAPILARDGEPIAEGPASARFSPPGNPAAGIAGNVTQPATAAGRASLYALGFPAGSATGSSGLERDFDSMLRGAPGGTLRAGRRTIATSSPRPDPPLRVTIDLGVQAAAEQALGGAYGGIAAVDPRTGAIRALAGLATVAQPPGSTFKIITTTAALDAGLVTPATSFPVQTRALVDGVPVSNAGGEACGGTFAESFAVSCNSVFVPLGVRVGAKQLLGTAERYGFNMPPAIAGTDPSTVPPAADIRSPLELGSMAIGQGRALATPIEMASVAQTIASGGTRIEPTLLAGQTGTVDRVTSSRVAAIVEQLMIGVVTHGTGTAAAIPGVQVAGKTGTAELGNTIPGQSTSQAGGANGQSNTDAWFAAYAPVGSPKLAVAALFVAAGAGGGVAAPAARTVLEAGLRMK